MMRGRWGGPVPSLDVSAGNRHARGSLSSLPLHFQVQAVGLTLRLNATVIMLIPPNKPKSRRNGMNPSDIPLLMTHNTLQLQNFRQTARLPQMCKLWRYRSAPTTPCLQVLTSPPFPRHPCALTLIGHSIDSPCRFFLKLFIHNKLCMLQDDYPPEPGGWTKQSTPDEV